MLIFSVTISLKSAQSACLYRMCRVSVFQVLDAGVAQAGCFFEIAFSFSVLHYALGIVFHAVQSFPVGVNELVCHNFPEGVCAIAAVSRRDTAFTVSERETAYAEVGLSVECSRNGNYSATPPKPTLF